MSHNGILASYSALRALYCDSTPDAKEYIYKELGFKSITSLLSRLNGLVPCDIHLLKQMIVYNEYYKVNVAVTGIGSEGIFDYDVAKKYYNALVRHIGSKDYINLSGKKKAKIQDEQNKFYKIINNNH